MVFVLLLSFGHFVFVCLPSKCEVLLSTFIQMATRAAISVVAERLLVLYMCEEGETALCPKLVSQ